ncbi:MAG: TM2 domain-containing protein [Firmicutes bacterium]|nr:TM2 domain-containing protein [Bacillota bacterium]
MSEPNKRIVVDEKLDKLYVKNVRCPYCRALIPKFTTTCVQCGVTKEQISAASHQEAKQILEGKAQGKVIMSKRRPDDLQFGRFVIILIFFGMFGAHNFYVGRKIRGWIMLCSMLLLIASFFIFNVGTAAENFQDMHPWRRTFRGVWFPFDAPGIIAIIVWFFDWFAVVVFHQFKYPVRLSTDGAVIGATNFSRKKNDGQENIAVDTDTQVTLDDLTKPNDIGMPQKKKSKKETYVKQGKAKK